MNGARPVEASSAHTGAPPGAERPSLAAVSATVTPRPTSARAQKKPTAVVALGAFAVLLAAGALAWTVWPKPPLGEACGTRTLCERDCGRKEKDLAACVALGGLQWSGSGGARDLDAAAVSFAAACEGKVARGCLELAYLYEDATGLAAKASLAPELRRRAAVGYEQRCEAEAGHACIVAGALYASGRGVTKSTPRAHELYARGRPALEQQCTGGSAHACALLSYVHARGLGGSKDNVKSVEVSEQACQLGDVASCMLAGGLYAEGPGIREVPKDAARAPASYRRACELGEARACHALARLGAEHGSSSMTASDGNA